jgi:dCTP deaminase
LFEDEKRVEPTWYENKLLIWVGINPFRSAQTSESEKQNSLVGYKARYTNNIIDLTKPGTHNSRHFFDPVYLDPLADNYKLVLEKDTFYILTTKQGIRVPPQYSMELVPSSHLMGELRVHYAGFFDPGRWAEAWSIGVLEVRPYEDLVIYDGQPICLAQLYINKAIPNHIYWTAGNNYHKQEGPKLAKYFY